MPLISPHRQQGAALIVSMIFLLILTLIGVSGLNNSGLESRMAHNFQLNSYVFHGAESAIQEVIQLSNSQNNPLYVQANDMLLNALVAGTNVSLPAPAYSPDPAGHLGGAVMTSNSSVQHMGATPCPGNSPIIKCELFEVTSTAAISDTGANTTHRQGIRLYIPGPSN